MGRYMCGMMGSGQLVSRLGTAQSGGNVTLESKHLKLRATIYPSVHNAGQYDIIDVGLFGDWHLRMSPIFELSISQRAEQQYDIGVHWPGHTIIPGEYSEEEVKSLQLFGEVMRGSRGSRGSQGWK